MNRIDRCSYCKVEHVPVDFKATSSHLQDPDASIPSLVSMDEVKSQGVSMAEFGQMIVGARYDQQLGYGYHELKQGSTIRLKQYKKIVLMDKVFINPNPNKRASLFAKLWIM